MHEPVPNWMAPLWPLFILCVLSFWIFLAASSQEAEARGKDKVYVPEIIEVEKPNAWCYVLKNDNSGAIGDIHMLDCIPKGKTERNPNDLSLEEQDSD